MKPLRLKLIVLTVLFSSASHADSLDKLKAFISGTQTMRAGFEQSVTDKNGKKLQAATGTMQFSRPGKFRWEYVKPYKQQIVGDGVKLWIFDPDLNQVTVKKLGDSLGDSPAALLAGNNDLEKYYLVTDAGTLDGVEWLDAVPKSKDTTFERVRMGFAGDSLTTMELKDNFGQTTLIRFSSLEKNPKLAGEVFKFVAPKGADVVGE
ncbi:MAG: outer membrane lipoprotein chaperone LolA [Burkholderiales bacterium]